MEGQWQSILRSADPNIEQATIGQIQLDERHVLNVFTSKDAGIWTRE
jgi:hypothetical protein